MTRSKAAALTVLMVLLLAWLLATFVMAVVHYPRVMGGGALFVLACWIVSGIYRGFRDL